MIYSKYTNNRVQKTKQISCEVVNSLHEKKHTYISIKDAVDNTAAVIFHIRSTTCTSVLL